MVNITFECQICYTHFGSVLHKYSIYKMENLLELDKYVLVYSNYWINWVKSHKGLCYANLMKLRETKTLRSYTFHTTHLRYKKWSLLISVFQIRKSYSPESVAKIKRNCIPITKLKVQWPRLTIGQTILFSLPTILFHLFFLFIQLSFDISCQGECMCQLEYIHGS